ncbi:MAG TPA: SE1832 family protein [Bacillota bacterium]|nr:SE1832 family protein [Bacillota bacterium]
MGKKALEAKLRELKSDYVRIQEDMDKLEFVGGRVSSAEQQLIQLEEQIAQLNKEIDAYD